MDKRALRILLVEDNLGDARLLREMFSKERPDTFTLTHLTSMHEAEAHLAKGGVDIVLLDMGLPNEQGLETLRRVRAAAPGVAMVVLTGQDDEALAANAIKEGAQDYLIKGQIQNRALPRALRYAIERHRLQAVADTMRNHQLQLRDDFLSHVSHELRSPLTSIYSFSTIIADGLAGDTSAQQDDYLHIILRNVTQLQSMIEDLLEVTQARAGKLSVESQATSVNEAIDYAVHTLQVAAREKEITLAFHSSELMPAAYADPTRLRQVLTILLDNAVKFTPVGGTVRVEARLHEKKEGMLLIEVTDTGRGIGPESIERIFEHLYQVGDPVSDPGRAGRRGLGLGLHIAKELVNRQGGEIWVTSEPHKGSHFFFTLPIFSLAGLIRPVLLHDKKPEESIAVIKVEIASRDGALEVPRNIVELARSVLQKCLRPDTDVLLPSLGSSSEHKLFFVVAYTESRGAEIIGKRILKQLLRHEELNDEFHFVVSHSFLPPIPRGSSELTDTFVEQVAAEVRDHINDICLEGKT